MPSELVSTNTRNLRASRETASPRSTLIASSGLSTRIPTFAATCVNWAGTNGRRRSQPPRPCACREGACRTETSRGPNYAVYKLFT